MHRIAWLLAVCLMFPALAIADLIKTESVTFKSGDETVSGYLARPDSPGPHPGLIVIQEWWGLNDWIKEQARKFAEQGFVALAPDLYRGQVATDPMVAHQLMQEIPEEVRLRFLNDAFNYLTARPDVNKDKIGSVGWCMGGGLSIRLAGTEPRLAACVVNYGALPTDPADIAKIKAPVLGNFGAEDRGPSPDTVRAFEKAMKAAGKPVDAKIYEGAGHAFQNPNNKTGYRPEAAADAWKRMVEFFHAMLR